MESDETDPARLHQFAVSLHQGTTILGCHTIAQHHCLARRRISLARAGRAVEDEVGGRSHRLTLIVGFAHLFHSIPLRCRIDQKHDTHSCSQTTQ